MDHEKRRFTDNGFWRWLEAWPVMVGLFMLFLSVGGYIATIKYIGERVNTLESRQDNDEKSALQASLLLSRISALQESVSNRMDRLEREYDGHHR